MAFTTVTGSNGVTSLVGTSGVDIATIVTLSSNVYIGAQGSDDIITVNNQTGNDTNTAFTVNGGAGGDTILMRDAVLNSIINGDGGSGTAGADIIDFGAPIVANSAINAGSGNDRVGAVDTVNLSNSTLNGNAGDDLLQINSASGSFIYGGQDSDTIDIGFALDGSDVFAGSVINGNKGSDTITVIENLASTAASTIYGGNGNDTINAGDVTTNTSSLTLSGDLGDDTLTAGAAIDTVLGGEGSDSLNGGRRGDLLTGGAGADLFVYGITGTDLLTNSTVSGNTGFDTITDFAGSATAANGDRFVVNTAVAAINSGVSGSTNDGTDLAATLGDLLDGTNLGANEVALVTILPGTTNAGVAGLYVVIGDGTADYQAAGDAVIKVNTLTGIGADQFVVV